MIKRIVIYSIVFISLFLVSYHSHQYYIEKQDIVLPFSLQKVYLFHVGFSLLICINILLLSTVDKFLEQLGFIYLGSIILKLILFCVTFYKSIFIAENLSLVARIALFIPLFIFLSTETIFVAKILNKKQ